MSLCLICGADGRKRCNMVTHMDAVRQKERARALAHIQAEANKYHQNSEAETALLEAADSLRWSYG